MLYLRIRFYFRFFLAVLSKYYRRIIISFLVIFFLIYLTPRYLVQYLKPKTTQQIGLVGRFTLSSLPLSIQKKLSIGLTALDDTGTPSPGIAESWTSTDSGKTYIFKLRTDAFWTDGKPLVSTDIKYNFKDASISYPDAHTIVFKLEKDAYAPLLAVVSKPLFKVYLGGFPKKLNIIGLGSYYVSSYRQKGDVLEYLKLTSRRGTPNLPHLAYHFYASQKDAATGLKLGEISQIENLFDNESISGWKNLTLTENVLYDRYVGTFYNLKNPDFTGPSGKNLRLALTYAIDKSRWDNRVAGPIPPQSWAYSKELKSYNLDLEKALSLLKKVDKIPSEVTITTVPAYDDIAGLIKSDWEKLGLSVKIQVVSDIPFDYQILLIAQNIPVDPDQYNLWHSTQEQTNLSRLSNPRIDKLLEDGRKETDYKKRLTIYENFQKYLLEECPVSFLYYPASYTVVR